MWGREKTDEGKAASPEPKLERKNGEWNQLAGLSASLRAARQLNKDAEGLTRGSMAAGLGATLRMKGEITGSQDLLIEGTFEGRVHLDEGKCTIGTTGRVAADIVASEVLVRGRVKGNVRAKNLIEIKKDGSVIGDITTQQILIEVGAIYKGSIEAETTHTVEPCRPKSAEVDQPVPQTPVPQPKDARVPSFRLADTSRLSVEKNEEKQPVETSKVSNGTRALRPQPRESSALSHAKEAVLSIFRDLLFRKENGPDFVSLNVTPSSFPTPKPPVKTSVNKRATPGPLLSQRTSSIKSAKEPRWLLRIAIAAAAIVTLFVSGRIAVRQHSQKALKDVKASAALNSPATSEPKQRNETSAKIRRRNLPTTRTRNSPGQNANVHSPVAGSEAVSNQAVAPAPVAVTPTPIPNSTEVSGGASHPPAEPTTQAVPTPRVPTSSSESKPVQTSESKPAQTGEGTTQSKDSNVAPSPSNSSAVPAETSPTPTATDKETNAPPPKQPEASEPRPTSGTVNPSAPPASGSPTETVSKKPRGPDRLQKGHLISRVNPVYPEDAQRQGIQGSVKVQVVFSPEGTVTNVTFVSGPQELAKAAMDAVRKWRYSPTLFDGKPVETEDEVTIEFRLPKSQRKGSKKDKDEDDEEDQPM